MSCKEEKVTGTDYFFVVETKELITMISVANSNEELADAVVRVKEVVK